MLKQVVVGKAVQELAECGVFPSRNIGTVKPCAGVSLLEIAEVVVPSAVDRRVAVLKESSQRADGDCLEKHRKRVELNWWSLLRVAIPRTNVGQTRNADSCHAENVVRH